MMEWFGMPWIFEAQNMESVFSDMQHRDTLAMVFLSLFVPDYIS